MGLTGSWTVLGQSAFTSMHSADSSGFRAPGKGAIPKGFFFFIISPTHFFPGFNCVLAGQLSEGTWK